MLDAAAATHVSHSLEHQGALLSPWPDIADEMIHLSFTDITDHGGVEVCVDLTLGVDTKIAFSLEVTVL